MFSSSMEPSIGSMLDIVDQISQTALPRKAPKSLARPAA